MARSFGTRQSLEAWASEVDTLARETRREREAMRAAGPLELPRISYVCQAGEHVRCCAAAWHCACLCHDRTAPKPVEDEREEGR